MIGSDVPPEVRAAFTAGPGTEPPLRLTPGDVLAVGRRIRRRRRALAVGGSGLGVLAVGLAAAITVGLPGTGRTVPGVSRPGPPPTSSPAPAEDREATARRLTRVLSAAVVLPPGGRFSHPLSFVAKAEGGYTAGADITDRTGTGSLFVVVAPAEGPLGRLARCNGTRGCTERRTPRGDVVAVTVGRQDGVITYRVGAVREDGTAVLLLTTNRSGDDQAEHEHPDDPAFFRRPTPPLSTDRLVEIALTPQLTLEA